VVRVRHHDTLARVEIGADRLPRALTPAGRASISAAVQAAGYSSVEIDPEPFRSGSLNAVFLGQLRAPTSALARPGESR
jgi:uncharacterized protein